MPNFSTQFIVFLFIFLGIVDAIHQMSKKALSKKKKFNIKFESINVVSEIFHSDGSVSKFHSQEEKLKFLENTLPVLLEELSSILFKRN